jgi:helix-turn-helix protein
MDSEYVSVDRAARMLGVSKRAVRSMAARGELEARRENATGRPVVSLASVERALSRQGRPGAAAGGRPAFS